MNYDGREEEKESLYKQLKYCRHLLVELRRARAISTRFNDWVDLIRDYQDQGFKNRRVDDALRLIIGTCRRQDNPEWNTVLTALFWPTLIAIYKKSLRYDIFCPDELWQKIHWLFLQSIYSIELEDKSYPVAITIYYKIRGSVRDAYESEKVLHSRFLGIDENHPDKRVTDDHGREMQVRDLISRIQSFQRDGIISEIDCHLIVGSLINDDTLENTAFDLGLAYENAKKLRWRALEKIRNYLKSLSPDSDFKSLL